MNSQLLNSTRNVIRSLTSYLFAKQSLAKSWEGTPLLVSMLHLTLSLMMNLENRSYFPCQITTNSFSRPNKTQHILFPHTAQHSVVNIKFTYVTNQTLTNHHSFILTQVIIKTLNTHLTVSKHGSWWQVIQITPVILRVHNGRCGGYKCEE